MADKLKLAIAVLLVIAGVAGFYVLRDSAMIIRVLLVFGGVIAGALVAALSAPGKRFYAFAQESVVETKKVVWPSRKETLQTTVWVFMFVAVMAAFLWLVDAGLLWMVKLLMGRSD